MQVPLVARIDSKTLLQSCYSAANVSDPVLKREVGALNQKISSGIISRIEFRNSKYMLADILTKTARTDGQILKKVLTTGFFVEEEK